MSISSTTLISIAAALAGNQLKDLVSDIEIDKLLAPVGLMRRRSRVGPALTLLGVGAVVGGAATLLFAPAMGEELRKLLSNRLGSIKDKVAKAEGAVHVDNGVRGVKKRVAKVDSVAQADSGVPRKSDDGNSQSRVDHVTD